MTEISTAQLLELALDEVRAMRNREDPAPVPALVALQARANEDTRVAALRMLESADPSKRMLAALIMREFPSLNAAPHVHSREFLDRLSRAVDVETDVVTLGWQLSAIGWQRLPAARSVLLRFANHADTAVRNTVGDNLYNLTADGQPMDAAVSAALLKLAADPDPWVASSVLYDVASDPACFAHAQSQFEEIAHAALASDDEQLRTTARNALNALRTGKPHDD